MTRRVRELVACAVLAALAPRADAAVEVRLRTGRVMSATSAQRVGDVVVVQVAGSTLRVPAKDVLSIVEVGTPKQGGGLNLPSADPSPAAERPSAPDREGSPKAQSPLFGYSESQLRQLLVDQPRNGDARLALAGILRKSGRLSEALGELKMIPADAPRALLIDRAVASADILSHLDRTSEALAALDAAPRSDASDPRSVAAEERLLDAREAIAADAQSAGDALVSTHFRVHVPAGVSRFDAAPLLDELERAHALIASQLGSSPREPIIVLLYPGDEFWEATGQGSNVGGLFDGKVRVPAGRVSPPSPRLTEVLRHEVAHAFVHVIAGGRAPVAWHEGVAEHFEGDDISSTQRALAVAARQVESAPSPGASRWPPQMTHEVSHARMEWFLSRYGMATLADVLRRMAISGVDAATRGATGLSEAELDEAWRRALLGER